MTLTATLFTLFGVKITLTILVMVLTAIYEVLTRVIPTNKTWALIGNVINVLKYISDLLDNKKK